MKTYVKPIIDVVELSVRENIAKLPTAIAGTTDVNYTFNGSEVPMTVYNLASVKTSEEA
ncbi:MAG: hypothetical protein IKV88_08395 [Clostridia bacterium]|jgi:hypothetical protein|nr:hypothetical protein [Clostridia bacterium]